MGAGHRVRRRGLDPRRRRAGATVIACATVVSRLESALDEFLRTRLDAERIDDLPLTPAQRAAKKADYFVAERAVVIEQKLLSDARVSAVRRVVDEFRRAPDGSTSSAELDRRVFDAAARSVWRCARSANLQIRATARHFALARPLGVLLLLNERGGVLEPAVLATAAADVLAARRADGARELAQLDVIVVVSAAPANEGLLWLHAHEPAPHAQSGAFEQRFRAAWSAVCEPCAAPPLTRPAAPRALRA